MAWLYLFAAGLLEIGWVVGLKYTDGFTKLVPTALSVASIVASLMLLGLALASLPVGAAYAVWTGIGVAGTAVFGIFLFGEAANAAKVASILLILAGITGLKLTSS